MIRSLFSLQANRADRNSLTPYQTIERKEQSELSSQFLSSLPSPTRQVMEFYYTNRSNAASVSDLARRLGMSRQNVHKLHMKGKLAGSVDPALRKIITAT